MKTPKIALIACAFVVCITSLPQLYLKYIRGAAYNGSCAYLDTDEFSYAAYTNALIDGRPRKNDPYSGVDNGPHESLFSIQFLPAYLAALPARILHVSGATSFIVLTPVVAVLSVLALLWLFIELTDDPVLAGIAAVGVLCIGTIASLYPLQIVTGLREAIPFFPFARRYIPGVPFPVLVLTTLFVWRALTRNPAWAILAGLGFAILVYSYFFLWTAMAAWFVTVLLLWIVVNPKERTAALKVGAILVVFGVIALAPYAWLVMQRAGSMDSAQLLEFTHAPDLFRPPELYGAVLLGLLIYCSKKFKVEKSKLIFAASFAVVPFLIFNQQIITGRSLQPFHYAQFVTNYWVVLAGFLAIGLIQHVVPKRVLWYAGIAAIFFGVMLSIRASLSTGPMNAQLDEGRAIALRLRTENNQGLVLASNLLLANAVATTSKNPVLWARHLYTFSNVNLAEQKNRFYQYLYYVGVDEGEFKQALRDDFIARWEVFGAERANPMLAQSNQPVSEEEIASASHDYEAFIKSFDESVAAKLPLTYAVATANADLKNLDRWYERTVVDQKSNLLLYRLKPRASR